MTNYHAEEILALDPEASAWDEVLACEPEPRLTLEGEAIDRALSAMGGFADLISPYLSGHSAGVAELAAAAAKRCRLDATRATAVRRAARGPSLGHHERLPLLDEIGGELRRVDAHAQPWRDDLKQGSTRVRMEVE